MASSIMNVSTPNTATAIAIADSKLIQELTHMANTSSGKGGGNRTKLVHCSSYPAPSIPSMEIQRWKLNEYKYSVVPSPFPTLARGLFSRVVGKAGKDEVVHKIVARGYDKFFNIGEVPWTTWSAIEKYTAPPYSMTLKSNGCIIFIGALTATKLIVTSKNSLGALKEDPNKISHAQKGEDWLSKHLSSKGKKVEDLASVLFEKNWTAVAELCDDEFEEHVLATPPDKAGLHLHGLNDSAGTFRTQPMDIVNTFAREWGFFETPYHTEETVQKVREFTDAVGQDGKWMGEAIEGFVVRCYVKNNESGDSPSSSGGDTPPPYPPGSSFFFKIKYDEPYMMYRDWREITNFVLRGKPVAKSKLRRIESRVYLHWVQKQIDQNRNSFSDHVANKGIIAVRQRFLDWLETEEGRSKLEEEKEVEKNPETETKKTFKKVIIVPVAIPGCGKTTIAVALKNLFGFGHIQSDDYSGKNARKTFINNVAKELEHKDVVIADKNNHQKIHRDHLRALVETNKDISLFALYWPLDESPETIMRTCSERIVVRGDNHQSLHPDEEKNHENALQMFMSQAEGLDESEVDVIETMDLTEDIEESLARAVDACVRVLGVPRPSREEIGRALSAVHNYAPTVSTPKKTRKNSGTSWRYYGFLPEFNLEATIKSAFAGKKPTPEQEGVQRFWSTLQSKKRVSAQPHVTIVHSNSLPDAGAQALWDQCVAVCRHVPAVQFQIQLGHIVYDDTTMAITVDSVSAVVPGGNTEEDVEIAKNFLEALPTDVRNKLHITAGTQNANIGAIEAGKMVERWRAHGEKNTTDVKAVKLDNIIVKAKVRGLSY